MKISLGLIIAICLIVYWYMKDHPSTQPMRQGAVEIVYDMAA